MADDRRVSFHRELLTVTKHAYFQPPANIKLEYPCIIYYRMEPNQIHANDTNYGITPAYEVTAISRDPEDETAIMLIKFFPISAINNRSSAINNLYHINLAIYY